MSKAEPWIGSNMLGQRRRARAGGDRERAQLAGLDVRQHRRDGVEAHRDLAADQVGDQRAAALVGNVSDLDPVGALELGADQVLRRAVAVGAEGVFARGGLDHGQQLGHVFGGCAGVHH